MNPEVVSRTSGRIDYKAQADLWLDFKGPSKEDMLASNILSTKPEFKKCLIVHNGIDGIAAATLAAADNYEGDIYAVGSECIDIKKMIDPYDFVTIVDMALKEKDMKYASNRCILFIYDHHVRNSYVTKYENCIIDTRSCASKLYYENKHQTIYGTNKTMEEFIALVNVFDRWQFDSPLFEESVKLFYLFQRLTRDGPRGGMIYSKGNLLPSRFQGFISSMSIKFMLESLAYTVDEKIMIDECIQRFRHDYIVTLQHLQFRLDERGRIFIFCAAIGNISLICNELLNKHKDAEYVVVHHETIKGFTRFSARSRGVDVDMNELEGFEGHPAAAGCFIEEAVAREIIRDRTRYFKTIKFTNHAHPPPMSVRRTRGAPPSTIINERLAQTTSRRKFSFKKQ